MTQPQRIHGQEKGSVVVRRPRSTDAIGQALRGAFDCKALPSDMVASLHRIDR